MNILELISEAQPLPFQGITATAKSTTEVEWHFATEQQNFSLRAYAFKAGKASTYKRGPTPTIFALYSTDNNSGRMKRKMDKMTKPLNVISTVAEIITTEMVTNKQSNVTLIHVPNKMNIPTAVRIMSRYIKLKAPQYEMLGAVEEEGSDLVYLVAARKGKTLEADAVFGTSTKLTMREFVEAKDDEEVQAALKKTNAIIRRMMTKVYGGNIVSDTSDGPVVPDGVDPSDVPVAPAITWDTYDHKAGAILNFKEAVTKTIAEGTMGSIADILTATPTVLRNIDWENTTKFPLDIPGGHAGEALYAVDLRRATQIISSHMMTLANNDFFNANNIEYTEKLQYDNWIVIACLDWFKELPQMSSKPAFTVNSVHGITNLWGLLVRGTYKDFVFGNDLMDEFKKGYSPSYDDDAIIYVQRGWRIKLNECSGPLRMPWLLDAELFVIEGILETMTKAYGFTMLSKGTYDYVVQIALMKKIKGTKWYQAMMEHMEEQVNSSPDLRKLRNHSPLVNTFLSLPEFHANLPIYNKILTDMLAISDDHKFLERFEEVNSSNHYIINNLIARGYKDVEVSWVKVLDRYLSVYGMDNTVRRGISALHAHSSIKDNPYMRSFAVNAIRHAQARDIFSGMANYDYQKHNEMRELVRLHVAAYGTIREAFDVMKQQAPDMVVDNINFKSWLIDAAATSGIDNKVHGDKLVEVIDLLKEEGWLDDTTMSHIGHNVSSHSGHLVFEGETALKLLEYHNEFAAIDGKLGILTERYWEIGNAATKKRLLNDIAEIAYEANKLNPSAVDEFFEKSGAKVQKAITDNMMVNEIIGGPLLQSMQEHSYLKPYGAMDIRRAIQMAGFNSLNVKDVATLTGIKFGKKVKPSEYMKQVMDKFADGSVSVPKPMVDKIQLTNAEVKEAHERFLSMHAGKHGDIYPRIINVFNCEVGNRKAFDKFFADRSANGYSEKIVPAVHGCGGIAANMILRYGYIVVPAGEQGVTGRMLGDGIYFTNKIDKAMLYVSNEGYGKTIGSRGYIFELDTNLGEPKKDYRSAGINGHDGIRSPEWCVKYPEKQTYIYKVYEVELVTRKMLDRTQQLLSESEPSEFVDFSKYMLTEATGTTPDSLLEVTFYTDDVPVIRDGEMKLVPAQHIKPRRGDMPAGAGVEIVDGYTTLRFPARQTEYWTFAQPKHLRDKDLNTYATMFEEYFDVVGYDD